MFIEEKREKKKSIIEPDVKAVSVESREIDIFQQFFYSINPIDKYDWEKGGKFVRTLMAIKAPFVLILRVLIPIVDLEVEGNGWSKMLNCMQIVVLPAFITLITSKSLIILYIQFLYFYCNYYGLDYIVKKFQFPNESSMVFPFIQWSP